MLGDSVTQSASHAFACKAQRVPSGKDLSMCGRQGCWEMWPVACLEAVCFHHPVLVQELSSSWSCSGSPGVVLCFCRNCFRRRPCVVFLSSHPHPSPRPAEFLKRRDSVFEGTGFHWYNFHACNIKLFISITRMEMAKKETLPLVNGATAIFLCLAPSQGLRVQVRP